MLYSVNVIHEIYVTFVIFFEIQVVKPERFNTLIQYLNFFEIFTSLKE
jgi:hypothetical protein